MGFEDLVEVAVDAGSDAAARSAQSAEGKKSRKFTERMYKQRYQNTMDDMLAAGLNPILAGNLGAGSVGSTPIASLPTRKLGSGSRFVGMTAKAQVDLMKSQKIATTKKGYESEAATEHHISSAWEAEARARLLNAQSRNEDTLYKGLRNQEQVEESQQGRLTAPLRNFIQSIIGTRRPGAR